MFARDTTARSAFNRGFETWLVSDACVGPAFYDGPDMHLGHRYDFRAFERFFGDVMTTSQVLERLATETAYGDGARPGEVEDQ